MMELLKIFFGWFGCVASWVMAVVLVLLQPGHSGYIAGALLYTIITMIVYVVDQRNIEK